MIEYFHGDALRTWMLFRIVKLLILFFKS
jgi:hypothetical protein